MSVRFKIKSTINKQSKTQLKIGQYILDNIKEIRSFTSTELSEKIGVSQSSIIKFIKIIGYTKFSDFKVSLGESLGKVKESGILHNDISIEDSLEEASMKISYSHIRSIEESIESICFDTLEQVIDEMANAKKIIIIGIGASALVAKDIQHKLTKIGKAVLFDLDYHVQITQVICADKGDLILAISHTGETPMIISALEEIKEDGPTIVSLTGNKDTSISNLSHLKLYAIAIETFFRTSAMSSRIAQMTMIDTLFIGLLKKDYVKAIEYIEKSKKVVGKLN